ncbi:MAG: DUF1800 domain-containing protein, partial [Candidatus Kapaibacterium sp.]
MNRRSFLGNLLTLEEVNNSGVNDTNSILANDLEAYLPDVKSPWDVIRAGHLLRRTTFMPRWQDLDSILKLTPDKAVDLLLDTQSKPKDPSVANTITESRDGLDITLRKGLEGQWTAAWSQLQTWQTEVMRTSGLSIGEKLTAFWSNHFTTEFVNDDDFIVAPLLFRQNRLLREQGLNNFRDLAYNITLDGGMVIYLGGEVNKAGVPNENYARELMELFTIGIGQYTEGDVQNAARILTGWKVARYTDQPSPNGQFNSYFLPSQHDIGAKEFLGVSFPARDANTNTEFIVKQEEIKKLIDVIFDKRGDAASVFLCKKLYRFFVCANPLKVNMGVVNAMAKIMKENDFDLKPVISALLKSKHFFDNNNIGSQLKTPLDFVIGLSRQIASPSTNLPQDISKLGQELFDPPNVSGWNGWHDWITTTTYPIRDKISQNSIAALTDSLAMSFINQFPNKEDLDSLIVNLCAILLPRALSNERKTFLKSKLTGGAPDYEWKQIMNDSVTAGRNIRELLNSIV